MGLTPTSSSDSAGESQKMSLLYFSNEFPHDDLQQLFRRLHVHSKDNRHTILAQFIDKATSAIREEVRQLPAIARKMFPPFQTVFDLADDAELRKGPMCGSIDGVLLCAVQLATFIGYHESQSRWDPQSRDTCLAGLGTGLLATAAVSLSPTLADIPLAGAEVVRIAFRLGVVVAEVSQNLQPRPLTDTGQPETWAYVVPDVATNDAQKELDAIHTREKTPNASKVFISAHSRTSVTISGPPSRLQGMFRLSEYFRDRKCVALPVFGGLCHAGHIYSQQHVSSIVQGSSLDSLQAERSVGIPVFSTSRGRPFPAKTASGLFESIIGEILTQPIQWDNVIRSIVERADSMAVSECQVLVFRNSLPIHDLVATLNSELQPFASTVVDLVSWIPEPTTGQAKPRGTAQSKIAIVGMSCRMPGGAIDTEKFWQLLEEGLDVTRKIPADRFDIETHYDAAGKRVNASHTPYGCFIDEPGLFDAPFFNMSPREAQQTDPMQRLALVTAYEALERAGYVANRTRSTNLHRIGTFYGQASDDYREVNTAQEISTYFIPGGCRAFGPGRINYFFKFSGPSFSCDTACSSSLATIQAACTSLWNGDTDMVVAGGMNVLTNSDAFAGLSHGHFLSKTPGACKTWDCDADGYCRADGIGSIVLKRLEDAEADNDNILGVVLGAATNHSAEAISITHPHAGAQSYLYTHVMNMAGLNPVDVNFVEMHGTGTQAGDTVEIKSISDVFAPITPSKRRSAKQPLYIGAVKSNVGHGEAAAGVTALLKVLLMLQKQAIPKHVGIKNSINTAFPKDLDKRNLHIPHQMTPWPRVAEKKRIAVVNNFSAAGGNTTLAIEEAPLREVAATDPRSIHVIAVSAKSKASLKGNIERLVAYLDANPDVSLSNLSYTTTARRHHHNHRVAIPTSDAAQLRKQLVSHLQSIDAHKIIPTTGPPPVVFAFTGQGASHRSMNLQLFHDSPYFRSQLCDLNTLAERQGFPSFIPAIDGTYPQDHAHSPVVTQLALVCSEIALAKYWGSLGVRPDVVVGHSLGEYAALHMAGVLSTSDAIFLVGQRANMLQTRCQAGSHKMLAVRASLAQVKESAGDKPYEVACINGPKDTVLSGTLGEIDALSETLAAAGYKCFGLDIDFAFHSAQTDPILEQFEDIARTGVVFHPPILPVISPLLGKVVFDDKTINSSYVRRATREPVNFLSALEMAHGILTVDETMVWVEVGPHPVCMGFVKTTLPSLNLAAASLRRDEDNWQTLAASLSALHCAGVVVDWGEFHRPFERVLRLLDLPTYAWNDKNYWIQYNGNWALTKGNTFYDADASIKPPGLVQHSGLMTSTMQRVVEESFDGSAGRVVVWSDLMEPDFYAAASGHKMNGCGVVTSSIHADIAFTLGEYLWKKLNPTAKAVPVIDICNLEVTKGLVAQKKAKTPQLIQVSATTRDIHGDGIVHLEWHNVLPNGAVADDPFASATIKYGVATAWLASWIPAAHLVQGRIDALERLAEQGVANRMSHNMAYSLFAGSLVDYAPKYRGMQAVVLHGLEAWADVTLSTEQGGTWTMPPHFIDSVAHLAGFVMNVSDALEIRTNFCVTPGWGSMRFARPLVAGGRYRSYVKMIPTAEDPGVYLGDVYVLQGDEIVGLVAGIKFRRYPRLLLGRFFSAPDEGGVVNHAPAAVASSAKPSVAPPPSQAGLKPDDIPQPVVLTEPHSSKVATPAPRAPAVEPGPNTALTTDSDSTAAKAIALVAAEAALELEDLHDVTSFAEVGVDSLMSLVIAEKLREELGVTVSGSLFLEYPTVGDLRSWLVEYYN